MIKVLEQLFTKGQTIQQIFRIKWRNFFLSNDVDHLVTRHIRITNCLDIICELLDLSVIFCGCINTVVK